MTSSLIITIDGPAGVGKSTVARMLAKKLGGIFLDTGATYRAVTVAAMQQGTDLQDLQAILDVMDRTTFDFRHEGDVLKVFVDGEDETQTIRQQHITENVKYVAGKPSANSTSLRMSNTLLENSRCVLGWLSCKKSLLHSLTKL
ncbi:MAG: (d)CMP kinase [Planctomycetota bacterium]|jgi:cytidylate kinase